jgi:hypothetical protein
MRLFTRRTGPVPALVDDVITAAIDGTIHRLDANRLPVDASVDLRIWYVLTSALAYGHIDGDHHHRWLVDQVVRALAGPHYEALITGYLDRRTAQEAAAGAPTWLPPLRWDTGVAP